MPRLLIAASGTGGHIYPALAVAEALPKSWKVSWLGVPDRLETELVPKCYPLSTLRVGGLQGSFLNKILRFFQLLTSTFKVLRLLRRQRIQIVFTTGGYISAPVILAAKCCRLPVVLHESNSVPGRVTRLLSRLCEVIALGLPVDKKFLSGSKTLFTGTPVRSSFLTPQPLPDWVPVGSGPLIVVMGGSQGSIGLNVMVREIVPELLQIGCRVVHLTGKNDPGLELLHHCNFVETPFSDEMPGLLQNADLAISRAGASSLSELAVCATPAVLIPYPYATDRHQDLNAACAAALGAAVIVHQNESQQEVLRKVVIRLLSNRIKRDVLEPDLLLEMERGMRQLSVIEPEKKIVEILHKVI